MVFESQDVIAIFLEVLAGGLGGNRKVLEFCELF